MKNLLKLTVAGGAVFGIWFALLVLFPKPDLSAPQVAEAEADIITFDFAAKGDQEKFVEVLEEQGLEKPRVYDWNGNTMFFSTTTTDESPRQVMRRFQEEFYRKGVNKRVHLVPVKRTMPDFLTSIDGLKGMSDITERKELSQAQMNFLLSKKDESIQSREILDDFFGGGMLPTSVSNSSVAMVGMTSKEEARTGEQFVKEIGDQIIANKKAGRKADMGPTLASSVKSMRFLEAFKTNQGNTRITATWSDDNLDLRKIENKGEDLNVDPDLPACVGCERLNAFKGQTDQERDFGVTVYDANNQSIHQVMTFYTRSLMNRGWLTTESSKVMIDAKVAKLMPENGSEMMNFSRDGKFLTLLVHKDKDGETRAHLVQSD